MQIECGKTFWCCGCCMSCSPDVCCNGHYSCGERYDSEDEE